MSNIDRILGENDIRKQYAPRKQFEAAKEAMDDPHCDSGDSNRELRNSASRCTPMQSSNAGWQRGWSHQFTSITECVTVLTGCSSRGGGNDYDQFCFH